MKQVTDGLPVKGHDLGDLISIGIQVEAKVDDLLLTAGEAGEDFAHLASLVGKALSVDGFQEPGIIQEVFEGGFCPPAGLPDHVDQVVA